MLVFKSDMKIFANPKIRSYDMASEGRREWRNGISFVRY